MVLAVDKDGILGDDNDYDGGDDDDYDDNRDDDETKIKVIVVDKDENKDYDCNIDQEIMCDEVDQVQELGESSYTEHKKPGQGGEQQFHQQLHLNPHNNHSNHPINCCRTEHKKPGKGGEQHFHP